MQQNHQNLYQFCNHQGYLAHFFNDSPFLLANTEIQVNYSIIKQIAQLLKAIEIAALDKKKIKKMKRAFQWLQQMISLQVNHSDHAHLRSFILKKELSETTQHTQQQPQRRQEGPASTPPRANSVAIKMEASDKESQVISSIKATGSKLKQDLQELINDYKDSAEKLMINHGYDPERETAIRQHLAKLQREKKQRREKMENDLAKLEAKRMALKQMPQKNPQELEQRRKSIEARIQRIHEREKRRREEEAQFIKFYEEYKSQKPKYKAMEEQFAKRQQREKEEKLKALKAKVEQTYKPMNLEELAQFEEEYENNRYQAQKVRLQNKLMEKKRAEANEAKLNELYKGHSHATVLKELQQRQTKTHEPHDKIKRIKQYSELVRQEYRPRVMSSNEETIDESQASQMPQTERGKRVLKERFLHGQYMGKKVEFEKAPLSHSEQISKGIEYLQYLKKLPKKPKEKTEVSVTTPEPKRTIASVYRVARERNPLYSGRRYNSIDFNGGQLRDGDSVRRMLEVMRHRNGALQLEERVMKNRSYQDRQDFMSAQNSYNSKLYNGIQQKLAILSQL